MSTTNPPHDRAAAPPDLSVAPWPLPLRASQVVEHTLRSEVLRDNPLGDPHIYRILGFEMCLRQHEARHIQIAPT